MRKVSYFPYLLLTVFLFTLLNLPQNVVNPLRSIAISGLIPSWVKLSKSRTFFLSVPTFSDPIATDELPKEPKLQKLQVENQILTEQKEAIFEWLMFDQKIDQQVQRMENILEEKKGQKDPFWQDFFQRRAEELKSSLDKQIQAYPAKVVFREPSSWCSSIWIDVGEEQSELLGNPIIEKNSPVVVGQSVIGVVEYVGKKQSRVRLITDSGLCPSVRAVRGAPQDQALFELVQSLLMRLRAREDLFQTTAEQNRFLEQLTTVKDRITQDPKGLYLAKGELHGSSYPLWRSRSQTLKGIGFNYDFPDAEGSARDLLNGKPYTSASEDDKVPLLKVGDLLVTSGLDGIFPPGLHVGIVSKLFDLEDGSFYYNLEAKPTAGNLDDLSQVFVLPPVNFEGF